MKIKTAPIIDPRSPHYTRPHKLKIENQDEAASIEDIPLLAGQGEQLAEELLSSLPEATARALRDRLVERLENLRR